MPVWIVYCEAMHNLKRKLKLSPKHWLRPGPKHELRATYCFFMDLVYAGISTPDPII